MFKRSAIMEREKEIKNFLEITRNVREGQGAVLAIMGEPGVGKTRLIEEFSSLARESGFQILQGRSYSMESDKAYTPVIEMFNQHLRAAEQKKISSWTKDLPHLGKLFRRLQLPEPPRLADPALEKTRLFESMACLLERMGDGQPLMIIQEDCILRIPPRWNFCII